MAKSTARPRDLSQIPIAVYTDPIFFHKSQVKTGTRFYHLGRLNPQTTWIVDTIWSLRHERYGWVKSRVADVRKLDDIMELRCEQTGERRQIRFGYASYSAIWRVMD